MKEKQYADELDNITVSYSHNTHNPYLTHTSPGNIINRIREDSELERIVDAIRSEPDKDERRRLKEENLPYFVLGTFENNHRKSDKLILPHVYPLSVKLRLPTPPQKYSYYNIL